MTLRLSVALSFVAMNAKHEAGEMTEVLRLAQRVIDLAEGDATKGNLLFGSPLALVIALRGIARCCLGIAGWKDDLPQATSMAKAFDPSTFATVMWHNIAAIAYGALLPDAATLRNTAETLAMEEQSGDDLILDLARATRGITLIHDNGPERKAGLDLLAKIREKALDGQFGVDRSAGYRHPHSKGKGPARRFRWRHRGSKGHRRLVRHWRVSLGRTGHKRFGGIAVATGRR